MANGIDYDALAKQHGAIASTPASGAVDYDALAKQAGAVSSTTDTGASISAAPKTGSLPWWKEKGYQTLEGAINPALPAIGGLVGGTVGAITAPLTGPLAPLNVVGGAALGGAGGEAARESIRQGIGWDQPSTLGQTAKDVAYQGAEQGTLAATGELAGAGINAGLGALKNTLNVATPAEQQATQFGLSRGIPVDAATATGNKFLKAVQAGAEHGPIGAYVGAKGTQAQQAALTRVGGELAEAASPGAAQVPESAGQAVKDALTGKISDLKQQADTAYDAYRSLVNDPAAAKPVQMGVDDQGKPIIQQMASPVDMRPIKQQLLPQYQRMSTWMQPALRDASQGYQAMGSIINGPDFLPAADAEAGLGGLKSLAREATGPDTANVSQGIAKNIGGQLQDAIDASVAQNGGSDALKALQNGRALHAQKMGVADTLQSLSDEPVRTFQNLTMAKDAGIDRLRDVASQVPGEMPKVGRAYIEDMLTNATSEGGFKGAQGLYTKWQNLGPETKKLLFPNGVQRQDLDNFFLLAKRLAENPNPSGTALVSSSLAQTALAFTNPMTGVPLVVGGGALAKMLRSPAAVEALTKGMTSQATAQGVLSTGQRLAQTALIGNIARYAYQTGAKDVWQGQKAQDVLNAPPVVPEAATPPITDLSQSPVQ